MVILLYFFCIFCYFHLYLNLNRVSLSLGVSCLLESVQQLPFTASVQYFFLDFLVCIFFWIFCVLSFFGFLLFYFLDVDVLQSCFLIVVSVAS